LISQSLVDSYQLEIVARARAAERRAERLGLDDFISDSPRNLALALHDIFEYLQKVVSAVHSRIDWANASPVEIEQDVRILRVVDDAVKYFSAHLRYVESGRTEKLPWEIIPAFEHLVRRLTDNNAQIMLRPMWHYNYATTVTNFRDLYLRRLSPFELHLPGIDVESKVLHRILPAFHMISFPALERENILLHSLIGHEIGHLIASRFLTAARVSAMLATVRPDVERRTDEQMREEGLTLKSLGDLFFTQRRNRRVAQNIEMVVSFWFRAVEELTSDVVGAVLFGPAALFATMEMAVQFGFDEGPSPQNSFYPPWRMRLRYVHNILTSVCPSLFEPRTESSPPWLASGERDAEIFKFVADVERECSVKSDLTKIDEIALARIAYPHVDATMIEAVAFVHDSLREFKFNEASLRLSLGKLVERLDHGIPPNESGDEQQSGVSVGLVEIINSAWFQKIISHGADKEQNLDQREHLRKRRNRLTLKAIEFAYIQAEFAAWTKADKKRSGVAPITGAHEQPSPNDARADGVLTTPEINDAMTIPDLTERLVVTPLLNRADTIHDAAIDVRLGTEFVVLRKQMMPSLNIANATELLAGVEKYQQRFVRRIREEIVLHPGQLIIGSTLEYLQVPRGLMCYVIGKSTWGRTGLVIATATKIDPGYRGCVTLEIINQGEVPIVLVPGIPIAQLVFHRTSGKTTYDGVYSCPVGPEFPRFDAIVKAAEFWLPR
jgi:dCTP deaminase